MKIVDTKLNAGICTIYPTRLEDCAECGGTKGEHLTVGGKRFRTVHMRVKLMVEGAPHSKCGYACIRSIEGKPVVTPTWRV